MMYNPLTDPVSTFHLVPHTCGLNSNLDCHWLLDRSPSELIGRRHYPAGAVNLAQSGNTAQQNQSPDLAPSTTEIEQGSPCARTSIMWIAIALICLALVIFLLKYVFSPTGPNPFDVDTREPVRPIVFDKKEKKKVLKQGEPMW